MQYGIPAGELEVGDWLTNAATPIVDVERHGDAVIVTLADNAIAVFHEATTVFIDIPIIVVGMEVEDPYAKWRAQAGMN